MYISCPNCATRYDVSPNQLGPTGKSVRCSNCGHRWHQQPVADPPPPPMRPAGAGAMAAAHAGAPPPQAYPYPPPGYPPYPPYPPPGYPPQAYPAPGPAPSAAQQTRPTPAPAEPEPPQPEPEPEPPEEEVSLPSMDDDEPVAIDDDESADADDQGGLSPDDIEAMFGDDDEPEALGSLMDDEDDDEDDGDDDIGLDDLDDIEEPEPIPQVFTAEDMGEDEDEEEDEEEDGGKGPILKIILAVAAALVIGVLGGAIFLRDTIIEAVPATEGVYSLIGLADDSLGAGLSINDVKSARESIAGNDVLVVRGVIVNVSERERPVPMLELRLSDLDGITVQSAQTAPLKTELAAGDQIGFKIQVEDPSPLARRIEVTFIERPQAQ